MTKPFRLPWHKRLLKQPWFQSGITWVVAQLLRGLMLTYRIKRHTPEETKPYLRGESAGIFCFWHGRMILLPFFKPKGRDMHVMISHHRDGELIARVIDWLGIAAVRGSGSKGVRSAVAQMEAQLEAGHNVSITPDGPRGPMHIASRGAVHLSQRTGLPLIPVTFGAANAKRLRSWDRFIIPYPFSHVEVHAAAPILAGEDTEAARQELETALNHITQEVDRRCGIPTENTYA